MSSLEAAALYEIVELDDGEIALRRADENGEPLVSVRFSAESLFHLDDARFEVAKAMIEAGLDAFAEISDSAAEEEAISASHRVLH